MGTKLLLLSKSLLPSFLRSFLRLGLKNLANWAVGPAAAHDEEDDGEQCCKKEEVLLHSFEKQDERGPRFQKQTYLKSDSEQEGFFFRFLKHF